jgi:hypothetical protein
VSVLVGHADAEKSAKLQHRLQGLFRSIEAPIRRYLSRARDDAVVRPGHMKAPETPKEEQVSGFKHFLFLFLCFQALNVLELTSLPFQNTTRHLLCQNFSAKFLLFIFEKFNLKKKCANL